MPAARPLTIPVDARKALGRFAVDAVRMAELRADLSGEAKHAAARSSVLRAAKASPELEEPFRRAAGALVDIGEDLAGAGADALIRAAARDCACDAKGLALLRGLADAAVQGAFFGLRSAARL